MVEHRLRMSDEVLQFIVDRLTDLQQSYEELVPEYRAWRGQHQSDLVKTAGSEYDKATKAYYETHQKNVACKDLIRRLTTIIEGGRPRNYSGAELCMFMVARRAEEMREAEETKAKEAEKKPTPKPEGHAFKLEIDGEAKKESQPKVERKPLEAKDIVQNEYLDNGVSERSS